MRLRYRTSVPLFCRGKASSMDENDDKQHDRLEIPEEVAGDQTFSSPPPSSRSIEPLGLTPIENMINQSANGSGNGAPIFRQPSVLGSRSNVFTIARPAAPTQRIAMHRLRINRILMRKRRLHRLDLRQNATSRVLVTFLIVAMAMA